MLANTAARVVISDTFGEFLDKRELEGALPSRIHDERPAQSDDTELWFDFVADIGDGFDPTYTIAYLLAADQLEVGGQTLPRGRFLMMGGDEVYPTPSKARYDDKTKGPYKAAMPIPPAGHRPAVYALPGNHDWYDGLSSFLRLFAKDDKDNIGGWRNAQARSYFAIRLPQRWWLVALDTQFGAYIDDGQLNYFRDVMTHIQPGDRVILCAPTPSWVEATDDAGVYDAVDYFMRTVLLPTHADVKVMLSGDLHHYARYAGADRQLIHCGGGGAYLYPTHRMPEKIEVPPPPAHPHHRQSEPTKPYTLRHTYPSKRESRGYAAGIFVRAPVHNLGFIALIGGVHTAFMYALLGMFTHVSRLTSHWLELPIGLVGLLIFGGSVAFANSPADASLHAGRRYSLGSMHGLVQLALGVAGTWIWSRWSVIHSAWPLPILASLIYLAVVGLASTLIVCAYLLIASTFGVNVNELFSAQSIIDSKSFLRLHIDAAGALTIYPIAVPKVSRGWRAAPGAAATKPWLEPTKPIDYELTEPPIVVS